MVKKILYSNFFFFLEKASNSICRQLLLSKLYELGFNDNTLKWFTSYLSNRRQTTINYYLPIRSYYSNY